MPLSLLAVGRTSVICNEGLALALQALILPRWLRLGHRSFRQSLLESSTEKSLAWSAHSQTTTRLFSPTPMGSTKPLMSYSEMASRTFSTIRFVFGGADGGEKNKNHSMT